jgi:hypothetical protein
MPIIIPMRAYDEDGNVHLNNTMIIQEAEKPKYAVTSEVIMKKGELITKLIENKAKHDAVLALAIEGYWDMAAAKLAQKREELNDGIKAWRDDVRTEFDRIDYKIEHKQQLPSSLSIRHIGITSQLDLVYPTDHSRDYERTLAMMQASVYDQVQLTVNEFDAYVLNNWEWKKNFLDGAASLFDAKKSRNTALYSGVAIQNMTGNMGITYQTSANNAYRSCVASGLSVSF